MTPVPDHGETTYTGAVRLIGKATAITGGDSGIGRAVAIAFAREGADVLLPYLDEHEDAESTARLVEEAGSKSVLVPGDLAEPAHCRSIMGPCASIINSTSVNSDMPPPTLLAYDTTKRASPTSPPGSRGSTAHGASERTASPPARSGRR